MSALLHCTNVLAAHENSLISLNRFDLFKNCRLPRFKVLSGSALLLFSTFSSTLPAASIRVDLVPFGRVVRYEGDSPETFEVHTVERGPDGWRAWKGENGNYMLGLEWDEPRDVAEVTLEFSAAFHNCDRIRVQYVKQHWPSLEVGGWAPIDDPFHGTWVTARPLNTWQGDRDARLSFGQLNEEPGRVGLHGLRFRRTYRLRILLGTDEPPPICAIHAYPVQPVTQSEFELRFDRGSLFRLPLRVEIVNGTLLDQNTNSRTALTLPSLVSLLRVAYLRVDVETQTRTVVTIRSADDPLRGFSFLPQEAHDRGALRIPALGVTVAARGPHSSDARVQPGLSIMDRVEREPEQTFERARREIAALNKSGQRDRPMYLPLGPPEARQEIAVSYDGSILLHNSALKSRADDTGRMNWPADAWYLRLRTGGPSFDQSAEGTVRQRLLEGWLPVVISSWETGGVEYEETCVATFLNGEPPRVQGDEPVVLLARLVMTNRSKAPAIAVVQLQTEPGETLQTSAGHVSAIAACGDKPAPYPTPRYRFYLRADRGAVIDPSETTAGPGSTIHRSEWQLGPGESRELELRVPFVTFDTEGEREQIASLDFDRVLHAESARWQRILAQQATIEVPDQLLTDFYKASLTHLLITGDRDPLSGLSILAAGTFLYGCCLNESCHQIRSLEMRGLHAEAQKYLDAILAGQSTVTLEGRFTNKTGVLRGIRLGQLGREQLEAGSYNLDHGFALWMLNEHYRFTRDRDWLAKNAPALIAACDFVTRERNRPANSDTLRASDLRWGRGLLPPGQIEDPPEWLWWFSVNAYAARGMIATAESLKEIAHPQARRIGRDARAFLEHLRDSCREAMIRAPVVRLRDGTYVPYQPTRSRLRGRDVGWVRDALYGPIHLIDCGIYADDSPEAGWILRDAEDNVFLGAARGRAVTDFDSQWFSWGGITIQANLLPNPLVYVRRGQPKMALRAFYNTLATFSYDDVRTFCEHPVDFLGLGEGPFYKAPDESAFIAWFRSLLICESGEDLELLPAVPLAWLADGKRIHVRGAATWFGPMNLDVDCTANRMNINVQLPTRNPPREARLHIRRPGNVRKVFVNGRPASRTELTTGVVVLRARR
jgi:hypothetical protein